MWPKIFELPFVGLPINSYGFMIMIGFLLAVWVGLKRIRSQKWDLRLDDKKSNDLVVQELERRKLISAQTIEKVQQECAKSKQPYRADVYVDKGHVKREDLDRVTNDLATVGAADFCLDLAIIAMIFGLLGGKLTYVLQNPHEFDDPVKGSGYRVFDLSDRGLHPMGALLGLLPVGLWLWSRRNKQVRFETRQVVALAVTTLVFAFIGVRGLFLYQHRSEFNWELFTSWQRGFVLYGGLVAAVITGISYAWSRHQPVLRFGDIAAPSMMLGVAFGRLGCFLNGCCFGKTSDIFCAVRFPHGSPSYETPPFQHHVKHYNLDPNAEWSLPVHPTQLYETAACVAMFFALSWMLKKNLRQGVVLLTMGVMYAAWRFGVEYLRDDPGREMGLWGLSFSQTASIFVGGLCAVGLLAIHFKKGLKNSSQNA